MRRNRFILFFRKTNLSLLIGLISFLCFTNLALAKKVEVLEAPSKGVISSFIIQQAKDILLRVYREQGEERLFATQEALDYSYQFLYSTYAEALRKGSVRQEILETIRHDLTLLARQASAVKTLVITYKTYKSRWRDIPDERVIRIIQSLRDIGLIPFHLLYAIGQNDTFVRSSIQKFFSDEKMKFHIMDSAQVESLLRQEMGEDFHRLLHLDLKEPTTVGFNSQSYRAQMEVNGEIKDVLVKVKKASLPHAKNQQYNVSQAALNSLQSVSVKALDGMNPQLYAPFIQAISKEMARIHLNTQADANFVKEAESLREVRYYFAGAEKELVPQVYYISQELQSKVMVVEDLQGETLFAKLQKNPNLPQKEIKTILSQFLDVFYYQLLFKQELHSEMHANQLMVDSQNQLRLLGTSQVVNADRAIVTEVVRVYIGILRGHSEMVMRGFVQHGGLPQGANAQRIQDKIQTILDKYELPKRSLLEFLLQASKLTQKNIHRQTVIAMSEIAFVLVNEEGLKLHPHFVDFYLALFPSLGTLMNLAFKLPASELKKIFVMHGLKFAMKSLGYGIKNMNLTRSVKTTAEKKPKSPVVNGLSCEMVFSP